MLVILEIATVALSFVSAFVYRNYLAGRGALTLPVLLGSLFAIVSTTSFFLTKSRARRTIVLALESIALALPFVSFPGVTVPYLLAAVVVVFLVRIWGERVSGSELESGMRIRYFRVVKPLLGKLISAGVLFAVALSLPRLDAGKEIISEPYFNEVFSWSMKFVKASYPQIGNDDSLIGVVKGIAAQRLAEDPNFAALDASSRAQAVTRAAEEIIRSLSLKFSLKMRPDEKVSAVAYKLVTKTFGDWYAKGPRAFLAGFGALLFFTFRGFGAILSIPIAGFAFLFHQVLLGAGVIRVAGESQLKEIIEYS